MIFTFKSMISSPINKKDHDESQKKKNHWDNIESVRARGDFMLFLLTHKQNGQQKQTIEYLNISTNNKNLSKNCSKKSYREKPTMKCHVTESWI